MRVRAAVAVLVAVLGVYVVILGSRGVAFVSQGTPVAVAFGLAVLALPVLGVVIVVGELRFGQASARLGRLLEAEGGLPAEGLSTRPSGRLDRTAADDTFEVRRREVEASPGDWRAWFRLGFAYGDAGDRPRGRAAMRKAIALERQERRRLRSNA